MFKKIVTITLAALLLHAVAGVQPASARTKEEKLAQRAEKVRAGILKLGAGSDSRVVIKLTNRAKLAGYISEVSNESFVVTDLKTRAATTVAYADVAQVKGQNLSTGAKIAIGIGIGVGLTILVIFLFAMNYD
jgi:hypothetical protein